MHIGQLYGVFVCMLVAGVMALAMGLLPCCKYEDEKSELENVESQISRVEREARDTNLKVATIACQIALSGASASHFNTVITRVG